MSRGLAKAREGYREVVQVEPVVEELIDKLFHRPNSTGSDAVGRVTVSGRIRRKVFGRTMSLTKTQALIFDLLTQAGGWVTPDQLLESLGKQRRQAMTRHALSQVICCLKREFEIADIGRGAIQSSRKFGYRLRPAGRVDRG
jgi:DNA-binding response OmpR family regulator